MTQRVSVNQSGQQTNFDSTTNDVTPDGRYVLFSSHATNLVPGDDNARRDIFLRDRQAGSTERVSVSSSEIEGNGDCYLFGGSVSPDARFVTFTSHATDLVPGDTNQRADVFLRNRPSGSLERVSVDSSGGQGNDRSEGGAISADGRYVAFGSQATNLVPGDTNGQWDVFVRDRSTGTTERVSVDSSGAQAQSSSQSHPDCDISADGRFVSFINDAANLVPGDTNGLPDVFVKDRLTGVTQRVSVSSVGLQQNTYSFNSGGCLLSSDGRWVGFSTTASNLVPGDTNQTFDGFVHDRLNGTTERVSVGPIGNDSGWGGVVRSVSDDGRFALTISGTDLVPGGIAMHWDVYVRDRIAHTTERVNVRWTGEPSNGVIGTAAMSPDCRYVIFDSSASNLVPGDTNNRSDVFVRDRIGGTQFTSLCDPGLGGVSVCPCSNPPSGSGRGCDNSAATGGATLWASGATFLSSDSLLFATSGQNPATVSIVFAGTALNPGGRVLGAGLYCAGGSIRRLYTKMASGGSISAPDLVAGDMTVSARSATMGDEIQPGQSRWYFVTYRDPVRLRGCHEGRATIDPLAEMMFNATQTGVVLWAP
ncbi:MAG: TolB family protein [Planctomycetota bacterium]